MKTPSKDKPTRRHWPAALHKGIVWFGVLAAAILFYFALLRFDVIVGVISTAINAIKPVIYGLVIAYLLNPVMLFCQHHLDPFFKKRCSSEQKALGISKALSITLAMLVGISFLVILCLLIIPQISQSILKLIDDMPGYLDNFMTWVNGVLNSPEDWAKTLNSLLKDAVQHLEQWMKTSLLGYATDMLSYVTSGIISVVNVVFNLFVGLVVAVYTLNEKKTFAGQSKKMLYALFKPARANQIIDTVRHGHKIFGGFIYGKILDSIIVGVVSFIVLSIMNMPYTLLVSVIVGVTNIIPFFGPFIGAIPSALLILLASPIKGLYFIIFIIVLQQLDGNIINPKIVGNTTGISAFWVTFSLLLFGGLFGVIGMIIGVPAFAVIYYLVQTWLKGRMQKRHLPQQSELYVDAAHMDAETGELVYDTPPEPEAPVESK